MTSSRPGTTSSVPEGPAVGILTRYPTLGIGKTRLAATIGQDAAYRLARAMLRDVCEAVRSTALCHASVFVEPPEAIDATVELTGIPDVRAQAPGHIGDRMLAAAQALNSDGYHPIILVGSDLPLLDPGRLHHALRALRRADVVFGPASDGGYYLIGMHRPQPTLLRDTSIEWSGPDVLATSISVAQRDGLDYGLLPESFDVDTVEDLDRLRDELERRKLNGEGLPSHTAGVLGSIEA